MGMRTFVNRSTPFASALIVVTIGAVAESRRRSTCSFAA